MNRLLVLGEAHERVRWIDALLGRLGPTPKFTDRASSIAECDGLVVVDDGGSDGFAAIQSALALRESHPGLPIAVVTPLDSKWSDNECLVRSQRHPGRSDTRKFRISGERVRAVLQADESQFEVSISDDAICFEYHE